MKQITISIPENFYKTFIDFLKHVPDAKIETEDDYFIPEWHKEETLRRIKTAKAKDFISWEKARKKLKIK
jgi:hypothetical protein